jgi:hypothetical protein
MIQRLPKIGEVIKIGWSSPEGEQRARVISIVPYTGRYPNYFTHVIRLTSNTNRGWTEIAWNKDKPICEWFIHKKMYKQ